jgi:hypothetical protein
MDPRLSHRRPFSVALYSMLAMAAATSCLKKNPPPVSMPDSVDIAQTPVENQFAIGFCWAYAVNALIESNYRTQTGEVINLSEEALGYVRMRAELLQLAQSYRAGTISLDEITNQIQGHGLEGWFVRRSDSSETQDAMEMIDQYGLLPEDVWSVKFNSDSDVKQLKNAIRKPLQELLTGQAPITNQAIDQVLTVDGAFHAAPPTSFTFKGQRVTAKYFASKILNFKSSDYILIQAQKASDLQKVVAATKRAMAAGYSVPISFGVSTENLRNGIFKAEDRDVNTLDNDPGLARTLVPINGSHAVIATDFVNRGGREGVLPKEELKSEVEKSASELAYLKFKNSWGAHASTTENGVQVTSGSDGYYRMEYGYMKAVAAVGKFGAVVPRRFIK